MNEVLREKKEYTGYEYRDIIVKRDLAGLYEDNLINFGWQVESMSRGINGILDVTLHLKRDRSLRNKAELSRLQNQFESRVHELQRLESSKKLGASAAAYSIGILGTAAMAGSVFVYQAGHIPLMILLAIPGFIGWVVPYFCFNILFRKKSAVVNPYIEAKYDDIYETGKQAYSLLNNN